MPEVDVVFSDYVREDMERNYFSFGLKDRIKVELAKAFGGDEQAAMYFTDYSSHSLGSRLFTIEPYFTAVRLCDGPADHNVDFRLVLREGAIHELSDKLSDQAISCALKKLESIPEAIGTVAIWDSASVRKYQMIYQFDGFVGTVEEHAERLTEKITRFAALVDPDYEMQVLVTVGDEGRLIDRVIVEKIRDDDRLE